MLRFKPSLPLALLFCLGAIVPARAEDADLRKRMDEAMKKVYPALVQIYVVTVDYSDGRELKYEAAGSGVIVDKDGHVVTNHHVAGKAKRIRCILADKQDLPAALVGTDAMADVSVLKLDLSARKEKDQDLPTAEWGDSDKLRVGDRVMAMGSPAALSQSVTLGIVSNTGFTMPKLFWWKFKLDGEEVGTIVKWIAHDAAIYGGNSGGPLIDLDGRIVGINEISLGLGGAIPGNLARDVAEKIVKHGRVPRSFLGFLPQPLLVGSGQREGVLVGGVIEGAPAAKAGVQPGDILVEFDGKKVTVRHEEELPDFNLLAQQVPIGKEIKLKVLREGKEVELRLTTSERENAIGTEKELKAWGITARQFTELSAKKLKRKDKSGVHVWSVRPGGAAGEAKPAIINDDVIVAVGGVSIHSLEHLEEVTQGIVDGQDKPVPTVVNFERKGEQLVTVVKLGAKEDEAKPPEVKKAWLPAAYQVLTTDLAEALGIKGTTGVRITQVFPDSTAAEAGLQVGDIVTHLDGMKVASSQIEEVEVLAQMIRQYKIGSEAELTILRGPKLEKTTLKVKLTDRPKGVAQMKQYKDQSFEFEARDIGYMDRIKEQWSEHESGALVTSVQPGSWAALAKLQNGDLIRRVNDTPVAGAGDLEAAMKAVAREKPKQVIFFVKRGISTQFVEVEPSWADK